MNHRKSLAIACCITLIACCGSVRAAIIGSAEFQAAGSIRTITTTMNVRMGMLAEPFDFNQFIAVGVEPQLSAAHVGTTWTSDEATMALIRSELQDADDHDQIGVAVNWNPIAGQALFGTSEDEFGNWGLNHAILAAQTQQIRFTLLSISFAHDGEWTEYTSSWRMEFDNAVPEPASASLLAIGGLALLARRR